MSKILCPICESNQVRKLSVLHSEGTQNFSQTGVYTGVNQQIGGLGGSLGTIAIGGTMQNQQAIDAAPPKTNKIKGESDSSIMSFTICIVCAIASAICYIIVSRVIDSPRGAVPFILAMFLTGLWSVGALISGLRHNYKSQDPRLKEEDLEATRRLKEWSKSFLCLICGNTFVFDINTLSSNSSNPPESSTKNPALIPNATDPSMEDMRLLKKKQGRHVLFWLAVAAGALLFSYIQNLI